VAHVDCPLTPDRIELIPAGGLNGDGVGHVVSFGMQPL
jgi:hypothetical protein